MREDIKAPMSEIAMKKLLTKLDSLSNNDNDKIKMLENAILNNWKSVYPLKDYEKEGEDYGQFGYTF